MQNHKETVLITGCSGFIGAAAMQRLADRYRIVGFDLKAPDAMPEDALFINVNLTQTSSVDDGIHQVQQRLGKDIRSVIHLAAYYDFSGEPSELYDELTVRGTQRLLHALHRMTVKQFVFSSTMLVHAPGKPDQPIDEDWLLAPKWDYPKSKLQTEQLLQEQHGSIPIVILRIAGVYDDYCHSIPLAHQIRRIYERHVTSHVFPGELEHGQSFVHLNDLVRAFELLVEQAGNLPEVLTLLVGESEIMSYGEIQRELGQLIHGEEWTTQPIPKVLAKTGAWLQEHLPLGGDPFIKAWMIDIADDHYALDIRRIAHALRWTPEHSLRETLPKMVEALKRDPVQWYREHNLELPAGQQEFAEAMQSR